MKRRLIAALACRAAGSRLYGKPLQNLDIDKRTTVLGHMIDLLATVSVIDEIVLGVAVGHENEPFHDIARARGLKSIRGDEIDVLQRLIQCAEAGAATDVFRVTTESPFTYFEAIEPAWTSHREKGNHVTHLSGLPDGPGFEIITLDTLRRCHREGTARHRSELCTLYVRENREKFQVEVIAAPAEVRRPGMRLTIDYPEDLVVCRAVYERFRELAPRIPLARIVEFLDARRDLVGLVQKYASGGSA